MRKILLSALALAALASCSKSEDVSTPDVWNGELRISSGIETRASGTSWDTGDAIGVFMNLYSDKTAYGAVNTKYVTTKSASNSNDDTYATATFSVYTDFADLYYPSAGNVDIVAHYPYKYDDPESEDDNVTTTSYPVDVTDQSKPKEIDFMSAKEVNVVKSSSALDLTFYHLLSQLKITLAAAKDGGLTEDNLKGATVTVSGMKVKATAAVGYDDTDYKPTATYTLSGVATSLELTAASASTSVTFIVVPQSESVSVTFTIKLATGEKYTTTAETLTFTSGNAYSYTLSVSNSAVEISGATIQDWGNGSDSTITASPVTYAVGDSYPDTVNPIGVVYEISNGGLNGKIVSLDEASSTKWSTETAETSATDAVNGRNNMKTILSLDAYDAEKYPAVAWVHAKNTDAAAATYTEGVTGVWYLPASGEFAAIKEVMTTLSSKLDPGISSSVYWASTEYSSNNAYSYDFSQTDSNESNAEKTSEYYVRAVLAF